MFIRRCTKYGNIFFFNKNHFEKFLCLIYLITNISTHVVSLALFYTFISLLA